MAELDTTAYLADIKGPVISAELKEKLDSEITVQEISQAVKMLPNGKCPSTDGLPIEFYKVFWPKLKDFIFGLFAEIVNANELHLSARQGIISLLEKIGRDLLKLKSWRPLTLLNSDLKIYSKILATRLHSTFTTIIHKSQTGFCKGRYIAENIMKMINLMEFCKRTESSAVVISIDFEKAFDKMRWTAAYDALRAFGIGEKFIDLVKILYNKPTSTVMNNGFWSDWFRPTRGCRQGDPFSALIFTVTAEILGIKLRANVNICGIKYNIDDELLGVQYADDTWMALEATEQNINNALNELLKYEAFSGLNVNYEKSVAFILGPLRDTDAKFYTLKKLFWTDGPVKILGINFHLIGR